jgi:hypothetical protein
MPARDLPARPNLEQYRKQAKELLSAYKSGDEDAIRRVREYVRGVDASGPQTTRISLADAQFVLAREHGFDSWPKFAKHIEMLATAREVDSLADPVAAFFDAATTPREGHASGTLARAEAIRARYPEVARSSIYAAVLVADEATMRDFLNRDPALASAKGGPYGWDALTYLCFSRYLRLDPAKSQAFVRTARALLDAGANANTGWYETIDTPPRQIIESAVYGAAGVAQHAGVTRLLLERGADPNRMTPWSHSALHQAVKRDNSMQMSELLVEHGANPSLPNTHDGWSATAMAAHRGRRAALLLFQQRGASPLTGVDALIAACALNERKTMQSLTTADPDLKSQLVRLGGTLLRSSLETTTWTAYAI